MHPKLITQLMKKITIYSTLLITIISLFAFKNSILNTELVKIQGGEPLKWVQKIQTD